MPMPSPAPLRIAQLAPLWTRVPPATYGGVELLLKLLTDELVARGHQVTLFATADCATAANLHAVCEVNLMELLTRGQGNMYEYYANGLMTEVLQRAGKFDVIHSHLSPGWLPLGALAPVPVWWTMHTNLHRDDEWALARYPGVQAVGISQAQMRACGLLTGREFPVVYNGCDFSAYEPSYETGEYLAFLGRMSPAKNPAGAIKLAQAAGMPIVLAGAPQNAQEEEYFAKEVKPLVDGRKVRWLGPVNHLQKCEFLRRAAALLFPIQWEEPFGLVMIEAMACGTPVLALRRGSVAEVVDDGLTGHHAGVLDALPELLGPTLALDRQVVRAQAERRFAFQRMVDGYEALYRAGGAGYRPAGN